MKRILGILLCALLLFSLCACANSKSQQEAMDQFTQDVTDDALKNAFEHAFGGSGKGSDVETDGKGTIKDPYQLGESFEVTVYDAVGFREAGDPIKLRISNVQVGEPKIEKEFLTSAGIKRLTPIIFDLEILETDVIDVVHFESYLDVAILDSNGRKNSYTANWLTDKDAEWGNYFPDHYIYFGYATMMPKEGAKWTFVTFIDLDEGETLDRLDYIMFNYMDSAFENHDIYMKI